MTRWRLLKALAIAVLLAILFAALSDVHAQDDPCEGAENYEACLIAQYPCRCAAMTPYGYWWFFFGCNIDACNGTLLGGAMTAPLVLEETVYLQEPDGSWRVELRRVYLDGSVVIVSTRVFPGSAK